MLELLNHVIYYPFLNLLTFFIWATPGHYAAVGILLLTLVVRLALIVPSRRAAQSQRRLAELQPLMEEIKREHAGDQSALAAAQMGLYRQNGVSPFSSCGFILIQLPILIVLNSTFHTGLTAHNPHLYSWVPQPEFINYSLFGINVLKPDALYVIPVLVALLQFAQVRLTLPPAPKAGTDTDPQVAMQRNMMYVMPVMMGLVARGLSAGLGLYWIISSLFSIIQQWFVNRERLKLVGVEKVVADEERRHPEFAKDLEKAKAETLGTETKKGVNVTVRKKK